ncbi:hypothetical protein AALO_G00160010 [Alosa alosa]|uniref:Uncharacterized protein n=1 Tax=Alosa alosa TaxID=278164 RepID=A0AAV6G9Y7_9TELE|nr:hypothetical protein AALO_G00160010 [Alosa alosa]
MAGVQRATRRAGLDTREEEKEEEEEEGFSTAETEQLETGDEDSVARATGGGGGGDGDMATLVAGGDLEDNGSEAPDTNAPPSSSSSSFVIPELRLDRSFSADALTVTDEEYDEDEDDEDEEEDDSDDAYLERSDSKRRSMAEPSSTCEKHGSGAGGLSVQNSLRRRTHSEGSLLQDPRAPCFTSDNAINCLDTAGGGACKGGWTLPSPKTLKKELTKNGGSMHQICMLFSGRKWVSLSNGHFSRALRGVKLREALVPLSATVRRSATSLCLPPLTYASTTSNLRAHLWSYHPNEAAMSEAQ